MKNAPLNLSPIRYQLRENLTMLKAAINRPKEVATIFPTSPSLARALLNGQSFKKARLVVELGPGTGAITLPLRRRLSKDTKYLGVEITPSLVRDLKAKFPELCFVCDSAERLPRILGKRQADAIVSSIPWTLLGPEEQERLLRGILAVLKPGGTFSTYVCLNAAWYPSARHLKTLIEKSFRTVEKGPIVWANLPPAFVYTCRKAFES